MSLDLRRLSESTSWLVTGFFTPDYRPLAERLAHSLDARNVSYHLFAKDKGSTAWSAITRLKPTIVLQAMDLYPRKTVVLLDVDAMVLGDMSPMLDFSGDVSAPSNVTIKRRPFIRASIKPLISSRAMVFKPTAASRSLAENWQYYCTDPEGLYPTRNDEIPLIVATMRTTNLAFCPMDARWAACEITKSPPGAVIVHKSEHNRRKKNSALTPANWIRRRRFGLEQQPA